MAPSRSRTGLGHTSTAEPILQGSVRAELLQGAGENLGDTDPQRSHPCHSCLEEGGKEAEGGKFWGSIRGKMLFNQVS